MAGETGGRWVVGHCAHCKASTDITDVGAEAWQNLLLLPLLPPPPCSAPTAPCRRPGGASQHVVAFPLTHPPHWRLTAPSEPRVCGSAQPQRPVLLLVPASPLHSSEWPQLCPSHSTVSIVTRFEHRPRFRPVIIQRPFVASRNSVSPPPPKLYPYTSLALQKLNLGVQSRGLNTHHPLRPPGLSCRNLHP